MALLTAEQMKRRRALPLEKVTVPELADGDAEAFVFVRALNALEADEWDARWHEPRDESFLDRKERYKHFRAWAACKCVCDEAGKPILTPLDIDEMSLQNAAPLTRIMNKIAELSARTKESREKLEKNLEAGLSGDSSSNSASNGVVHQTRPASELAPAT